MMSIDRIPFFRGLLIAIVLSSFAFAKEGTETIRFDASNRWFVADGEARGGSAAVGPAPQAAGPAARITWQSAHAPYLLLRVAPRLQLAPFDQQLDGTFSLRLYRTEEGSVQRVNLRLIDSRNIIYQWKKDVQLPSNQWHELTWRIAPDNYTDSWNHPKDEKARRPTPRPPMRLSGIVVRPGAGGGTVYLNQLVARGPADEVSVPAAVDGSGRMSALKAIDISVRNPRDEKLPIMRPGRAEPITLLLHNRALQPVSFDLSVQVQDFWGKTWKDSKTWNLRGGKQEEWTLALTPARQGIYWISYMLSTPGGEAKLPGHTSLALMAPAGPTQPANHEFLLGICAHTLRFPQSQQELEVSAAALAGAKFIRTTATWQGVEPRKGVWKWEKLDRLLHRFTEQGIRMQYLLGYSPRWASTAKADTERRIWNRTPPHWEDWADYVRHMAERYKDRIQYWEVWNEPNIGFWRGSVEDYLKLLTIAHQQIKAVDPSLQVMNGGFAAASPDTPSGRFLEQVLRKGKKDFNVLAWHEHRIFTAYAAHLDRVIVPRWKKYVPDRPLILNEAGINTWHISDSWRYAQRMQAEQLVEKIVYAWSRGAKGYFWYELRDGPPGRSPRSDIYGWGLLHHDFTPRASYVAFNTLAEQIGDAQYDRQFELGAQQYAFGFKSGEDYKIVTWIAGSASPGRFVLQTDARQARMVDLMGEAHPAAILSGGRVILPTGRTPQYLILSGATHAPSLLGGLIELDGSELVVPGRRRAIHIQVVNPFDSPQSAQLAFTLPSELGGRTLNQKVEVQPGQSQSVSFEASMPLEMKNGPSDRPLTAQLDYRYPDVALSGTLPVLLHVATAILPEQTSPQFVLDRREQVTDVHAADPTEARMNWKGPADLSAKVFLSQSEHEIVIRVEVMDDKHVQPFSGLDTWKGDNIQMGINLPGQNGYWAFELAQLDDGQSDLALRSTPAGFEQIAADRFVLATQTTSTGVRYRLRLSLAALGLTSQQLERGIRLSLMVNDNDGQGRKGWIALSPGIQAKDPSDFPYVVFLPR